MSRQPSGQIVTRHTWGADYPRIGEPAQECRACGALRRYRAILSGNEYSRDGVNFGRWFYCPGAARVGSPSERETCLAHLRPEPCEVCAGLKAAGL